ncbi:MAG TPA: substrate-binding domain-containing protein [Streptosporangiaceae bacterium]|nr:substrate-binding domain-containing protein [Streptosporangiaceae bacterium]
MLASGLFTAACGGPSASGGPAAQTGTATTKCSGGALQAAAKLKAAKTLPQFKPNAPVNLTGLKGKNITIITSTESVPFVAAIAAGAAQAANALGMHATVVDGKGSVAQWSQLVQQATAQHVAGIITVGASPAEMKPAVSAATSAGIPVVDTLTADQGSPLVAGTFAHVSISFYNSGRLQADYVIASCQADAHVLILGDNEFPGEVTRVQGMKAEFARLCPACKLTIQDTQVANLSTTLASETQTLLRRDPSITWVLPTYDAQATYIVPAIKQMGPESQVKVVGSDAVPSQLALVAGHDVQVADVGEPTTQSGWAAVDMLGRALTRNKPVDPDIPLRMFTVGNLVGLNFNSSDSLFGSNYRAQYLKLWGLR